MKKIYFMLIIGMGFYSCASKAPTQTAAKENKPVISVLDSDQKQKNEKTAVVVPDSSKSVPQKKEIPVEVAGAKGSPKETIKSYTSELQSLYEETKTKSKNQEQQIANKVRRFFDFNSLARLSLGSNWDRLSAQKKTEYSSLFTQLIEKSYLKRSRNLVGNYQLSYGNEKIKGNEASVACNIYKDDVDLEIVYELHKVNTNGWMIYNIIFDQVNLVRNYQSQFNRIVAKSGIDELLRMMRKKLKENDSSVDAAL